MIVTRKKPVEQVLAMLHGVRRVALVGCGNCAAACQTGGEKELEQMRQLLQEQGIETVGTVLPDECCHMLLVKRDLKPLRDSGAEAIVCLACGDGRLSRPIPRSRSSPRMTRCFSDRSSVRASSARPAGCAATVCSARPAASVP